MKQNKVQIYIQTFISWLTAKISLASWQTIHCRNAKKHLDKVDNNKKQHKGWNKMNAIVLT